MKKVKMLISFLLFLLFTSSQVKAECSSKAQDIPMYKKRAHLGTRTGEPTVMVSLADEMLTINVSRYVGEVRVVVVDATGCVVANQTFGVDGKVSYLLETLEHSTGFYSITIELDNVTYYGIIDY